MLSVIRTADIRLLPQSVFSMSCMAYQARRNTSLYLRYPFSTSETIPIFDLIIFTWAVAKDLLDTALSVSGC